MEEKKTYAKGMTAGAYKHNFAKEHYDRVALNVPKGRKDEWKALAAAEGLSLSEWIIKKVEGRA